MYTDNSLSEFLMEILFQYTDNPESRGRNVPDCLPVSSDRQNVFLPVSTNI